MSTTVIIAPTQAAVTSGVYAMLPQNNRIPSTVVATNLANADNVKIQISVDQGVTFHDIYINGTLQEVTATNNVVGIDAPGYYRFVKTVTAAEAGVYLISGVL